MGGGERWEGGGERKRDIVAFSCMPRLGIEPAAWACALTGNQIHRTKLQATEPGRPGPAPAFCRHITTAVTGELPEILTDWVLQEKGGYISFFFTSLFGSTVSDSSQWSVCSIKHGCHEHLRF